MNHSTPGLPVHHQLPESTQTHARWVSDAIQPSHSLSPLLLLPSIFPSIRVFSNESVLHIKWPNYFRSFSFSISPSQGAFGFRAFNSEDNFTAGLFLIAPTSGLWAAPIQHMVRPPVNLLAEHRTSCAQSYPGLTPSSLERRPLSFAARIMGIFFFLSK